MLKKTQVNSFGKVNSLGNTFIIFVSTDFFFLIIGSYGLSPNLVLNSTVVGTVEYTIIQKSRSSRRYIPVQPAISSFPYLLYFLICSFVGVSVS